MTNHSPRTDQSADTIGARHTTINLSSPDQETTDLPFRPVAHQHHRGLPEGLRQQQQQQIG